MLNATIPAARLVALLAGPLDQNNEILSLKGHQHLSMLSITQAGRQRL